MPAKQKPQTRPDVIYDALAGRQALGPDFDYDRHYSSADVLRIIPELTLRQIQWWCERGILAPVMQGHQRSFTYADVYLTKLVVQLRDGGISLQQIRRILRAIASWSRTDGERGRYLVIYFNPDLKAGVFQYATSAITFMEKCRRVFRVIDLYAFAIELNDAARRPPRKAGRKRDDGMFAESRYRVAGELSRLSGYRMSKQGGNV
jgi:DNA-binding transcriptional MerR regulator